MIALFVVLFVGCGRSGTGAGAQAKAGKGGGGKAAANAAPKAKAPRQARAGGGGGKSEMLAHLLGAILVKSFIEGGGDDAGQPAPPPPVQTWPGEYQGKKYPVIRKVESLSIAEKAGIQPGDIYIKYNGISLDDESTRNDAALKAIDQARKQGLETVVITLVRGGLEYEKTIPAGVKIGVHMEIWGALQALDWTDEDAGSLPMGWRQIKNSYPSNAWK